MKRGKAGPAAGVTISWRALSGLSQPESPAWQRVAEAQLRELARRLPLVGLANIVVGLVLIALLWGRAPLLPLAVWGIALGTVAGAMMLRFSRRHHVRSPASASPSLRKATVHAMALGALWAMPGAFFAADLGAEERLAICLLTASIMGTGALAGTTVPAALIGFTVLIGAGLTAMMLPTGSAILIAIPALYAACLVVSGLANAQAFIRSTLTEAELAEKSDVVSLLLREFEDNGADWLWQVDVAKRLQMVSTRLARAAGRRQGELEGRPLLQLLAGDGWREATLAPELAVLVDRMNARESFSDLQVPVVVGEETRWWCLSAAPRFDDRGSFVGFHGVGSDVTDHRRSQEQIAQMARFDALTGLPNRVQLLEAVRDALARSFRERGRCALMLIDLDKFKPVNDTLGHPVGDELLRLVAERLRGLIGDRDCCGRLGGDEFAIAVGDARDLARVDALGEAVIRVLGQPFEIEGNLVSIGASVGIAVGPKDGRSVESLLRNADLALYRAKEDGRGVHRRYQPALLAQIERRRAIESALREALEEGQFRLLFRPIVETGDGSSAGFEAVLRWAHPTMGELEAREFMGVAEDARLATRIGEWVLREACACAASWDAPARVSVNLSLAQLSDPRMAAILLSALSHSGLAPDRLEIEVSEDIFLNGHGDIAAALDTLQRLGVRVALCDFGTGYAALGYVKKGRFSSIKIGEAFVRRVADDDPESLALMRAVSAMATTLGLSAVAEGVDNDEDRRRVRDLGFAFAQPVDPAPLTADEARALLGGNEAVSSAA